MKNAQSYFDSGCQKCPKCGEGHLETDGIPEICEDKVMVNIYCEVCESGFIEVYKLHYIEDEDASEVLAVPKEDVK